jgi:hypothetical protein
VGLCKVATTLVGELTKIAYYVVFV